MLRRRSPAFFARAILDRRAYVVLWKMLRIYPRPWSSAFREPNFRLARQALRRDAGQKIRELSRLIEILRDRELRTVVEIGSDRGGTLYAWCQLAAADATIVSIDLPGGPFGRGRVNLSELATSFGQPRQTLHFLEGDSHDPAVVNRLRERLNGAPIDFLMIDGDHTYAGVKADFEMYTPLVAPGGIVALHDILPHDVETGCEVDRFWAEVSTQYRTRELVDPYDDRGLGQWGGIGVVFWGGDDRSTTAQRT